MNDWCKYFIDLFFQIQIGYRVRARLQRSPQMRCIFVSVRERAFKKYALNVLMVNISQFDNFLMFFY